jgi:hypothetical protein
MRTTALDSAAQQAVMLERVNAHYSSIVDRLVPQGVDAVHDYRQKEGAIPVPATFLTELGEDISRSESGMYVRHYSDHPFRSRKDGGPKDDFERETLEHLRLHPDQPVFRFEDFEGRPSLRYATARRMLDSCVRCHNTHLDSTKRDWQVGDVRGVLEIIRPLDRDVARAREGLRGTFLLMAGIAGSLLGLSVLVVVVGQRRRSYNERV